MRQKVIIKCANFFIAKCDSFLQNVTVITNCDDFITNIRQLLQNATFFYYKLRQYKNLSVTPWKAISSYNLLCTMKSFFNTGTSSLGIYNKWEPKSGSWKKIIVTEAAYQRCS